MDRLTVFDLDDTLIRTRACVVVNGPRGRRVLTPAEYTAFHKDEGDAEDFSQFNDRALLDEAEEIRPVFTLLRAILSEGGRVAVVTARERPGPVAAFLESRGAPVPVGMIHAVTSPGYTGDTVPDRKASAFRMLAEAGHTDIVYYDDCSRNLASVRHVCKEEGVRIECVRVEYIDGWTAFSSASTTTSSPSSEPTA